MKIEHAIDIDATPARVWELTLDVESWPEHTPTMEWLERLETGPVDIGSRVRIKQPGQRAKVWTVSRLEPEQSFAWSTTSLGMTMTGEHHLTPNGTGTMQRLVVDIAGPLAPVLGPLLRRPILGAITRENEGFKSAAEAD